MEKKWSYKLSHCMVPQIRRQIAHTDFSMVPCRFRIGLYRHFLQIVTICSIKLLHLRCRQILNGICRKKRIADFRQFSACTRL